MNIPSRIGELWKKEDMIILVVQKDFFYWNYGGGHICVVLQHESPKFIGKTTSCLELYDHHWGTDGSKWKPLL